MNISQQLKDAEQAHRNGQLDIAQKHYEDIIKIEQHTDALYGLGTVFMQKKLYLKAIPLLQLACKNDTQAADIAYNLALCHFNLQQFDEALKTIESFRRVASQNINIAIAFAQLSLNLNSSKTSILLLESKKNLPDQGLNILATAYMKEELWLEAQQLWSTLTKKHPSVSVLFANLSLCATKLSQNQIAVDAYKVFVKLEPTARNFIKFADLLLMTQDCSGARDQLNKAIDLNDTSVERYEVECKICRLENNTTGTKIAAEQAILQKPDSCIAWQVLQELNTQELNQTCISKLTELLVEPLKPSFETQQNLFTLAKALEKEKQFKLAFTRFKQANDLQYERFLQKGTEYQPNEIETQYKRIQSVNYNVSQPPSKPSNIFVVGMPRSGTTLVNRLLSQPDYAVSCNESNAAAIAFERDLLNPDLEPEQIAHALTDNASNYYQTYQQNTGKSADLIVDKMPHNFRLVGAILSTFPSAKIIQMRRDPQDLALSIYSHQFHEYHSYACSLPAIAHAIVQANQLMDYWSKAFPEQVLDISYQNFVSEPLEAGKALFNFCGIDWQDGYLNFYKTAVPSFTFSEVQVRQPINASKISFSKHYDDEFEDFRRIYEGYQSSGR